MDDLTKRKLELLAKKRKLAKLLNTSFDSTVLGSGATEAQQEFLDDMKTVPVRWAVAANQSGKSTVAAREAAWVFNRDHPTIDINGQFGTAPLLMLVLGQKGEQIDTNIWERKIKPFLVPGTFKEVRQGGSLQKVIGISGTCKGNIILFQSHNNANEARKNIQGYVAQWVWIDEMPGDSRLVSELIMRIITSNGRFLGTFTPLVHNIKIRRMVDNAALPIGKRYKFLFTDNPSIADMDAALEKVRQSSASDAEFRTRVYGDWTTPGSSVSAYNPELHLGRVPPTYERMWRHIAGIDPSASGLTGLTVWAEDPKTGRWYNMLAVTLQGKAAFELVDEVESLIAPYNIVNRVCDNNPAGYWQELARRKIKFQAIANKANNKLNLIDGANCAILKGTVVLTEHSSQLEEELIACVWKEAGEGKIVNSSSYHMFDTLQYVVACLPKWEPSMAITVRNFDQQMWIDNKKEKAVVAKKQEAIVYKIQGRKNRAQSARNRKRSTRSM